MTKDKLTARLEALRAALVEADREAQNALNKGQAINGAIQECEFWLAAVTAAELATEKVENGNAE